MGGMRNTARFRASEGVHERRDQVWGEGNNRVERRTGCPRGAGPSTGCVGCSTGCVGCAGNQQIGRGRWKSRAGGSCRETGSSQEPPRIYATHAARPTLAGFPAACDQSDGSPRSPCNLRVALHRNCRLAGATHGGWSTPRFYGSSRCTCERGRKGAVFRIPPTILSVRVRRI